MQFNTLLLSFLFYALPMFVSAAPIGKYQRSKRDAPAEGVQCGTPAVQTNSFVAVPTEGNAPVSTSNYKVQDFYQGQSLIDQWDFYDKEDPTHGTVKYQSREDAIAKGLARVDGNRVILSVDTTSDLPPGGYRDSVRISSKKTYTGGLFIADFDKMPFGPTRWPAWWTVGPQWPGGGEIDVLEGANSGTTNQYALHTAEGCTLDPGTSSRFAGTAGNLKCASGPADNSGCQIRESDERTYGAGFNAAGGGVYAHLWDQTGIKIWHFARSDIPADITSQSPDPSKWGIPSAFFSFDSCDPGRFFDHHMIINTTLCGDWAGSAFPGGKEACLAAVADRKTFQDGYNSWEINYIAVYNKA